MAGGTKGLSNVMPWLSGAMAVAGQVREFLDCDLVRHLERKLKILRNLRRQIGEIFFVGKFVVSRIHTNRLEGLGIFCEAVFLKP